MSKFLSLIHYYNAGEKRNLLFMNTPAFGKQKRRANPARFFNKSKLTGPEPAMYG